MATKTYTATRSIDHGTGPRDRKTYAEGDSIDLSDEHAAPLLACGAVVGPVEPAEILERDPEPKGKAKAK